MEVPWISQIQKDFFVKHSNIVVWLLEAKYLRLLSGQPVEPHPITSNAAIKFTILVDGLLLILTRT